MKFKDSVLRTPDTDIFVILQHHAHEINLIVHLDTGSEKHRQLVFKKTRKTFEVPRCFFSKLGKMNNAVDQFSSQLPIITQF